MIRRQVHRTWMPSLAGGGASWVKYYDLNWAIQTGGIDLKTTPYTDSEGVTWTTADHTVTGEANVASATIVNGTGVVIPTSAGSPFFLGQRPADLIPGFALGDRIAWIVEFGAITAAANYQLVGLVAGDQPAAGFAKDTKVNQVFDIFSGPSSELLTRRTDPGGGAVTEDTSFHTVLGFDILGDTATDYYGAALPAEPFTGLTPGLLGTANGRLPNAQSEPWPVGEFGCGVRIDRNGLVNFTTTIKRMQLWRWE